MRVTANAEEDEIYISGYKLRGAMSIRPQPVCPPNERWRCVPWKTRPLDDGFLLRCVPGGSWHYVGIRLGRDCTVEARGQAYLRTSVGLGHVSHAFVIVNRLSAVEGWDKSVRGRIAQRKHRPRDTKFNWRIVQLEHHPIDASFNGRIFQDLSFRDTSIGDTLSHDINYTYLTCRKVGSSPR